MNPLAYAPEATGNLQPEASSDVSLDQLLGSKSRILRTTLEVLALQIQARFAIWDRNLDRIRQDEFQLEPLLVQATRLARYHLHEQQDATRLRDSLLELSAERREQDIECWRDIVLVMRDFLYAWDAHEQARSRSIFINHAGTRPEEPL